MALNRFGEAQLGVGISLIDHAVFGPVDRSYKVVPGLDRYARPVAVVIG